MIGILLVAETKFVPKLKQIKDFTIAYQLRTGTNPSLPVLFCIHGMPGTMNDFQNFASQLPEYSVLSMDLPGFNQSSLRPDLPYTPSDQAARLLDLIRVLDLGKIILVAHSYGGGIAQILAPLLGERCQGLVLFASVCPVYNKGFRRVRKFFMAFKYLLLFPGTFVLVKPLANAVFRSLNFPTAMTASKGQLMIYCQALCSLDFEILIRNAPEISCPIWYGVCENDPFLDLEEILAFREINNRLQMFVVNGKTHFLQERKTDEILPSLKKFLDDSVKKAKIQI